MSSRCGVLLLSFLTVGLLAQSATGYAAERIVAEQPTEAASADASLATYRSYAIEQADALVLMIKVLTRQIKAGDLEAAQNAYAPAHRFLERIRPVARLAGDLDGRMDATAADYGRKENDPAFSGFHAIEYGLFARRSTAGLSVVADRLYADALTLRRQAAQGMAPDLLRNAPAELIEAAASRAATGEAEFYSRTDLWDIEANLDGVRAILAVLRPEIDARDRELAGRIAQRMTEAHAQLSSFKDGCGFKGYGELTQAQKTALTTSIAMLGVELSKLRTSVATE